MSRTVRGLPSVVCKSHRVLSCIFKQNDSFCRLLFWLILRDLKLLYRHLRNVSVTQQVKRLQKSHFHLHLSNPLPSIHWFSPCLCCSPPAELLSACHELRCRYGCVMTRNGTFCFCADGFEVGEDGTSCRGRIQLHRRGGGGSLPDLVHSPVPLWPRPNFPHRNKQDMHFENHLSAGWTCLQWITPPENRFSSICKTSWWP